MNGAVILFAGKRSKTPLRAFKIIFINPKGVFHFGKNYECPW